MIHRITTIFAVQWLHAAGSSTAAYEKLLKEAYPQNGPGAAVIVVKDGKTLLRQAQGMASIELGVPLQPDMVFRLGSSPSSSPPPPSSFWPKAAS